MTVTDSVSQKLRNMAFVCAVLVVGIHVVWVPDSPISFGWWGYWFVKEGIARIAVPFFFVVSGFFLGQHFKEKGWWRDAVKKRVFSLVVPFYIWCVISVVWTVPVSIAADIVAHRAFGTSVVAAFPSVLRLSAFNLVEDPVLIPLWYVRCLFLFVLLSGVFKVAVCRLGLVWLVGVFLLMVASDAFLPVDSAIERFLSHGLSLSGIFYFSTGIYLSDKRRCMSDGVALFLGVIGAILMVVRTDVVPMPTALRAILGRVMIPFLLCAMWHFMSTSPFPKYLTENSFPIYLMHGVLFGMLGLVLKGLNCGSSVVSMLMYGTGVFGSLIGAVLIRKGCSRLSIYLFGGR